MIEQKVTGVISVVLGSLLIVLGCAIFNNKISAKSFYKLFQSSTPRQTVIVNNNNTTVVQNSTSVRNIVI